MSFGRIQYIILSTLSSNNLFKCFSLVIIFNGLTMKIFLIKINLLLILRILVFHDGSELFVILLLVLFVQILLRTLILYCVSNSVPI